MQPIFVVLFAFLSGVMGATELYIDRNRGGSGALLGNCAADCDDDGECEGDLQCWQRGNGDMTQIPGCTGDLSVLDNSGYPGWDYCYDPNANTPSVAPTTLPTDSPTVEPTDTCDETEIHAVNWHNLLNVDGEETALLKNSSSVTFDAATLSLTFRAAVEYVGKSADGNFNDDYNLGTSYWIGFQSFSEVANMSVSGSCANREGTDYDDLSYDAFWKYTVDPADLDSVPNAERMAYPPSEWSLNASSCSEVVYEREFSWTELTSCTGASGEKVIDVEQTNDSVVLSGTLFVELVSPYSTVDTGYYRLYPLVQQDFGIQLNREVNVLASTGVQLFISSVMAYGRDADGNYELTILTQSADYVMLGMDDPNSIDTPDGISVSEIEGVNPTCLTASSFTCGQIFTATIPAECPDGDSPTVDLSGDYQFSFTPTCRDGDADETCNVFLTTLQGDAGKVVLDVSASYRDPCDTMMWNATLTGNLTFYVDENFADPVDDDSDPFVIGQDTIYGKVIVDIPKQPSGEMYQFLNVSIENIYVCTAAEGVDLTANLDANNGLGGCFSSGDIVDGDGPYKVYGVGAVAEYEGSTTYPVAADNEAAFSFLTFDTPRETIAVHVQLLLTLEEGAAAGGRRRVRRRMLLQESGSTGNAFRSYIGTADVQRVETVSTSDPVGTDDAAAFAVGLLPAMLMLIGTIMG